MIDEYAGDAWASFMNTQLSILTISSAYISKFNRQISCGASPTIAAPSVFVTIWHTVALAPV